MGIKDSLPKQASLCKYTWEVIACMVIISKWRSGPDIWPETPNQSTSTEDMILTTWSKEAMKQSEINLQQQYLSSLSPGKLAMQVIQAPIRKRVMFIHLQILDSIMGLWAHTMGKHQGLVGIHY